MVIQLNESAIPEFFFPTRNVFWKNVGVDIDGEVVHKNCVVCALCTVRGFI